MKFKIENIQWGENSKSLPDHINITTRISRKCTKLLIKDPDYIGDVLCWSIQKAYNQAADIRSFIWYTEKNPGMSYRWIPMYEQIGPNKWRRNR